MVKGNSKKGFTLIELLVVVSIISLLSSIVFAALNSARAKGRDARRISDVQQLQLALELYYSNNGSYPASPAGGFTWAAGSCNPGSQYFTSLAPLVAGGYISALPVDPVNSGSTNPVQCLWYFTYGAQDHDNCNTVANSNLIDANQYEYVIYFSSEKTTYSFPTGRPGPNPSYCYLGPHR